MVKLFDQRERGGFTLAELLVVVALVAILAAMIGKVDQNISASQRKVQSVAFTADGTRLVGAFNDGSVQSWRLADGMKIGFLPAPRLFAGQIEISGDGQTVARACYEQQIPTRSLRLLDLLQICDTSTGAEIRSLRLNSTDRFALSPDGKLAAVADRKANAMRVIDIANAGAPEITLAPLDTIDPNTAYPWLMQEVRFSPDGDDVYYSLTGGDFAKWNLDSHQTVHRQLLFALLPRKLREGKSFAISRDGSFLATHGTLPAFSALPSSIVQKLDASNFKEIQEWKTSNRTCDIAYINSGKSLAVLSDQLEILDAKTMKPYEQVPLEQTAYLLAASSDGKMLAVVDWESIYLYDGMTLRKFVDYRSAGGMLPLTVALAATFIVFAVMRQRRKYRACEKCGKRWLPRGKTSGSCCPDCGLAHLTTAEIARIYRQSQGRMWRPIIFLTVISAVLAAVFNPFVKGDEMGWKSLGWICAAPLLSMAAFYFLFYALNYARCQWLRRWRSVDYSLAAARKAAGVEGLLERHGPISLWMEGDVIPISAATIATQLDGFRIRLAEVTGVEFGPAGPLCLLLFSRAQVADRFSLRFAKHGLEQGVGYLGPWANLGYISMEGTRRKLTPLEQAVNSILVAHLMPVSRSSVSQCLGIGLSMFVAYAGAPGERDSWRRVVGVWCREGTLLPLKAIFRRETLRSALSESRYSLRGQTDETFG